MVRLSYRACILCLAHGPPTAGHLGSSKTLAHVAAEFYWTGMTGDVTCYCQSCDTCQQVNRKTERPVPLGETPTIDTPFRRVTIDLIGKFIPPSGQGHRWILTVIDYATLYPGAVTLSSISTVSVATVLFTIFSRVGFPKEILSDRGTQFTSELTKEINQLLREKQFKTTHYHPTCNGLVENLNATLTKSLKKLCIKRPRDWDLYLPAFLFALREVPQDSTLFSPFELLFCRTVRGPYSYCKNIGLIVD